MKTILISFASMDPKFGYRFFRSQEILVQSAKGKVSGYISYSPNSIDSNFAEENKHILNQSRGYGYWLWKPYIMNRALEAVDDGDIIVYADSGNSVINDLTPLFTLIQNDAKGIVLFDNRDGAPAGTTWKNKQWTKYDCFKKMNCLDEIYLTGNQVNGSYAVFKKNEFTKKFLKEYLQYCTDEDVLTDKPNTLGDNFESYVAHRHDQSVISLLAIKYQITLARDPSEWGNDYITEQYNYPQLFNHHRGFI